VTLSSRSTRRRCRRRSSLRSREFDELFTDTCDACEGKKVGAPARPLRAAVIALSEDAMKVTDKFPMEYVDDLDDNGDDASS
jgi:hypothetical protein